MAHEWITRVDIRDEYLRKITRIGHKFLAKSKKWIRVEPSSQEVTGRGAIFLTSAYATDTEISLQEISWGKNKYCWRHRNSTLPGWYISSVTTCGESIIRMASWSFLLISHVGMEPKDHSAIRSRQITALYPRLSTNPSSHSLWKGWICQVSLFRV